MGLLYPLPRYPVVPKSMLMVRNNFSCYCKLSGFGGLVVSMLASGTQDRGFAPDRSRRIFSGEKILSMPSFGGEVKPSVPCRSFAACKRSVNDVKRRHFGKITDHSRPQFHLSLLGALALMGTWRNLAVKVGMSKGR
jgi:hypothetical protein